MFHKVIGFEREGDPVRFPRFHGDPLLHQPSMAWVEISTHSSVHEFMRIQVRRSLARFLSGDRYTVGETPLKTRHSRRVIADLSVVAIRTLRQLSRGDDPERDYVFLSRTGGPIDPDNLDRAFKRHLDLAGLPEIRFHDLRHRHASLLIAAGVHPKAIQARLGQASITTTLNTYGHLMPSAFVGLGEKLDTVLRVASGGGTTSKVTAPVRPGPVRPPS